MNILMFTTLLILLYPPLKGFSHRSDSRIHVYQALLLQAPQGVLKPKWLSPVKLGYIFIRECWTRFC